MDPALGDPSLTANDLVAHEVDSICVSVHGPKVKADAMGVRDESDLAAIGTAYCDISDGGVDGRPVSLREAGEVQPAAGCGKEFGDVVEGEVVVDEAHNGFFADDARYFFKQRRLRECGFLRQPSSVTALKPFSPCIRDTHPLQTDLDFIGENT